MKVQETQVAATLRETDAEFVWHPFTQAQTAAAPHVFVRGEGGRLYDDLGGSVLDLISSWWVNLHGHAHPAIAAAIAAQAHQLEHVLFAGASHPPAIRYAQALIAQLRPPLRRVFYSDNGSTAVEVALKISLQYWQNRGTPRRRLLAFEGGYHGDTFGAMSAGRSSPFFSPFVPWLFPVDLVKYASGTDNENAATEERRALRELDRYLAHYGNDVAACILEPLVQGAGGMRMARPEFVQAVVDRVRACGALVIFDEVFTGFGRTGTMFAYEHVDRVPDLLCLAKGMTGGFLPLAATVATEEIYAAFRDPRIERALLHGHSFTANPLGCAAALASLELFKQERTLERITAIGAIHREGLATVAEHHAVSRTRSTGTIAAFDLDLSPDDLRQFTQRMYATDVFLRPLGRTVYLVPPYCLDAAVLRRVWGLITRVLHESFPA